MISHRVFLFAPLCAFALHAASARAASVHSQVFIGQGDGSFVDTQPSVQSNTFGENVEAVNSISHNIPGGGTLTFDATVFASTTYQSLKSSTTASITNTYYDADYSFGGSASEQTGVPTHYDTYSVSRFTETLQYGGTAVNYISTYLLNLSGTIIRDSFDDVDEDGFYRGPQVTVRLIHANEPAQVWSFREAGDFNLPIYSSTYVHGGAPQTFFLEVITNTAFRMESLPDGSNVSGSALFGSTLDFIGVDLRDADTGEFLADATITNDLGQSVPVVMIPEPGSSALALMVGLAALATRRPRRQARVA